MKRAEGALAGLVSSVTHEDFDAKVLKAATPIVVDFTATWCGPCRAVAPIVEQLSQEYAGKVAFAKLDIDESPAIMEQYSVEGVPTLILFKDGKELSRQVGAYPKIALKGWLEGSLGGWK